MKRTDWELTRLNAMKRQAESTDKPSDWPDYIRDMRQNQDGVWERRPALGKVYPDRGNQYEFTTPVGERGINSLPDGDDSGTNLPLYERYYNAHRRKQIVHLIDGSDHWVFRGVIEDHNETALRQRLQIWRSKLQSDHVSEVTDPNPAYSNNFGKIDNECYFLAIPEGSSCIQYSMVAGPDNASIYLAIVLKKSGANDDVLWVVKLTSLFQDAWGIDTAGTDSGFPVWTGVGNTSVITSDGTVGKIVSAASGALLSQTIDLEIESSAGALVKLHLIYGYYDVGTSKWSITYDIYTASSTNWSSFTGAEQQLTDDNNYGAVLKLYASGTVNTLYLAYLRNSSGTFTIRQRSWVSGSAPSSGSTIATCTHDANEISGIEDYLGPALAIDGDGTLVFAWRNTNPRNVMVKFGASAAVAGQSSVNGDLWNYYTNWDIVAKDGLVVLYYGAIRSPVRLFNPDHVVWRRVLIGDTTDSEYTDGTFFDPDLVEEAHISENAFGFNAPKVDYKPDIVEWIACYNTYESDNLKDVSLVATCRKVGFTLLSFFKHIRQDRGVFEGASDVTMKQPHRWDAQELVGQSFSESGQVALIRLTALQAQVTYQGTTKYPFYERRDWQWMLMQGQMSESNGDMLHGTIVADNHANFTDLYHTLRAGCGIDNVNNWAIWSGFVNRWMLRSVDWHDVELGVSLQARGMRLQGRRWRIMPRPEPDIGRCAISRITAADSAGDNPDSAGAMDRRQVTAPATLYTDEPALTGGYEDVTSQEFHYLRFCPKTWRLNWNKTESDRSFDNGGVFIDLAPFPYPVAHPFRTLEDDNLKAYLAGNLGSLPIAMRTQPFIEVFVGISYRFYDGQSSQIIVQESDTPYKVGLEILSMAGAPPYVTATFVSMLKLVFTETRWDMDNGIDPRVAALEVHVAERGLPNQTKWDCVFRKAGEVLTAKFDEEGFKGEAWNGDDNWKSDGFGVFHFDFYLDLKKFLSSVEQSDDVDHLGFSPPVKRKTTETPIINGFKYMRVIDGRPFFLGYFMNGKSEIDKVTWAGEAVRGNTRMQLLDYASPARFRDFPFEVKNGAALGDGKIAIVGDRDIEYGRVRGEELQWAIEQTRQNVGTYAAESVARIAESSEGGGLDGLFFLSNRDPDNSDEGGGRVFDGFKSTPVTDEVLKDAIVGGKPVATRVETTYKGVESLSATDAMALHLPLQRLFLLNFPTENRTESAIDGVMLVRDFGGEAKVRGGGNQWSEWRFGKEVVAWCLAPEGYLIFTDGELLYRWPDADGASTDAGVTISPLIRLNTVQIPAKTNAQINEITLDYECTGSAVTVTLVRDDGGIVDKPLSFPASTTRTRATRRFGYAFPFTRQFAIQIELATPATCTAFKVHGIAGDNEMWKIG